MKSGGFKRHFKVFVSSPSDVMAERRIVQEVIRQHNSSSLAKENNYHLDSLSYEDHTTASAGMPQAIVNQQMGKPDDCDVFVCILWSRMGTEFCDPQSGTVYSSGTAYEFAQALEAKEKFGRPEIMLYRCTRSPREGVDAPQAARARQFFEKTTSVLYKPYSDTSDFAALFARELNDKALNWIVRVRLKQPVIQDFRSRMLNLVEHFWIGSGSDPLAEEVGTVDVTLTDLETATPERFSLGGGQILRRHFTEKNCRLVILGEAGTGKSFIMLRLLELCLEQARRDRMYPIPIVLNAASWMERRGPVHDWIVDELQKVYNLKRSGKDSATWLVENRELLLCLDGLDEIRPDGLTGNPETLDWLQQFVELFNRFLADHQSLRFVVTCRTESYRRLAQKIQIDGRPIPCLGLEPLSEEAIARFLSDNRLTLLRAAYAVNPRLQELSRTVFLLMTMGIAYRDGARGVTAQAIHQPQTREEYLRNIFNSYVEGQLSADTSHTFPAKQTECALRWLGHRLDGRRSLLLVEQMQPNWLNSTEAPRAKRSFVLYSGLLLSLFVTLAVGIPCGAAVGYEWAAWAQDPWLGVKKGLFVGSSVGLTGAMIILTGYCMLPRWTFALFIALAVGTARGLLIALSKTDDGSAAMGVGRGLQDGLMTFVIAFFIFVYVLWQRDYSRDTIKPLEVIQDNWRKRWRYGLLGLPTGIIIAIAFGLLRDWGRGVGFGVALGMMVALIGIFAGTPLPAHVRPNQGIIQSMRHALRIGLVLTLIGFFAFGTAYGMWQDLSERRGQIAGMVNGLLGTILFVVSLFFGGLAVMQHYGLRLAFWHERLLPLRLVKFLDYAAERRLMRKVGGGYVFLHEYLRDYFKQSWK